MFHPSKIHLQAQGLREQAKSVEALSLYEKAITEYIGQENPEGIIRILLEKDITYRHLWFFTEHHEYIELSASALQMAEHIFHHHERELDTDLQALVLFHVGQVSEAVGETYEAIEVYQEALELIDKDSALYGNILSHLAQSEWRSGKTETAQQHFQEGHQVLEKFASQVDEHTATVWIAGSLLRQAESIFPHKPDEARKLLKQAKKMLDSQKYPIRWKQVEKLEGLLAQ